MQFLPRSFFYKNFTAAVGIYYCKIYKNRTQLPAKQWYISRSGLKNTNTLSGNDFEKKNNNNNK